MGRNLTIIRKLTILLAFLLFLTPAVSGAALFTFSGEGGFAVASDPIVSFIAMPISSITADGTANDGTFLDFSGGLTLGYSFAGGPSPLQIFGNFDGGLAYTGLLMDATVDPLVFVGDLNVGGTINAGGLDLKDQAFLNRFGIITGENDFQFNLALNLTSLDPGIGLFASSGSVTNLGGQLAQVPEPGTLLLLVSGLVGLVGSGRRKLEL